MLVNELASRIGDGLRTFTLLLTRFTTPEELFGPMSVAGLKKDEYRRLTAGKLPESELAFLDEIFKANSAVLNALLTLLNERLFDNGSHRITCPLITCFGASNEMPQGEDLGALWDRFALRLMVDYVGDGAFAQLVRLGTGTSTGTGVSAPVTLTSEDRRLSSRRYYGIFSRGRGCFAVAAGTGCG
jgi:MoxR-like ATPase